MYSGVVLEHFRRPRNQRSLPTATAGHEAHNPLCGDRVRVEVVIESGVVCAAAFTANACAVCTAAASVLTERATNLPLADAMSISDGELIEMLDASLPAARIACATLPLRALHGALARASISV